jgi:type IV secretory pathway VirD2 relaxase
MDRDDRFELRPGRIGRDGKAMSLGRDFRNRVIKTANLARGGRAVSGKASGFTGERIGRGSGAGAVLASRAGVGATASNGGLGRRRVVVKARIVKLAGKGRGAAIAHMRYVQRDGVTRSGERGELYDGRSDVADGKTFLERSEGDRHQFRFIVSPEDGQQYEDLRNVTRRLMTQMETDLGTQLDWVAVDHFNTGHPHTHILIRGKDDHGKDLIIARNYITEGVRERAAEIVGFDLGPRTALEVSLSLQHEMTASRYTTIDRWIEDSRDAEGRVRAIDPSPERQSLITGRLRHLETLELATPDKGGLWQVSEDFEAALRQLGRRGDIINSLRHNLALGADGRMVETLRIHDAGYGIGQDAEAHRAASLSHTEPMPPIIGRVAHRGLYDELEDRHLLVIDGVDGHTHVVEIGKGETAPQVPTDAIVRLTPKVAQLRSVDHTIAEVAAAKGGYYSVGLHMEHDRKATMRFAETHVRRIEAVRRAMGGITWEDDYSFRVGQTYRDTALAYEQQKVSQNPVNIEVLSPEPLRSLERRDAWTWLDKELTAPEPTPMADTGFGKQVTGAIYRRVLWMSEQGLIRYEDGKAYYPRNLEQQMAARELKAEGQRLSQALGKTYVQMRPWVEYSGTLKDKVTLNGGQYALVERAKDFALVPWRDVLERQRGKEITGMMHENRSIEWSFGRDRGISIGF